jgi:hypothetical protein
MRHWRLAWIAGGREHGSRQGARSVGRRIRLYTALTSASRRANTSPARSIVPAGSAKSAILRCVWRCMRRPNIMLTRAARWSSLKAWAMRVATRQDMKKAKGGARPQARRGAAPHVA